MAPAHSREGDVPVDFGVLLNLAFGSFKAGLHAELARAGFDDVGPSFGYVFRLLASRPHNHCGLFLGKPRSPSRVTSFTSMAIQLTRAGSGEVTRFRACS